MRRWIMSPAQGRDQGGGKVPAAQLPLCRPVTPDPLLATPCIWRQVWLHRNVDKREVVLAFRGTDAVRAPGPLYYAVFQKFVVGHPKFGVEREARSSP